MGMRKTDDPTREIQKLRSELESLELERQQHYESRHKLDLTQQKNERLVSSLQEAKTQIESLRKEVEKLTAPPSTFAIFTARIQMEPSMSLSEDENCASIFIHPLPSILLKKAKK